MSSSGGGDKPRNLKPPSILPDLPYIPRWPPSEPSPSIIAEEMEVADGDGQDETEGHNRDKRQTQQTVDPAQATTYCDGVDEIGCYQVMTSWSQSIVKHSSWFPFPTFHDKRSDYTTTGFWFQEAASAGKGSIHFRSSKKLDKDTNKMFLCLSRKQDFFTKYGRKWMRTSSSTGLFLSFSSVRMLSYFARGTNSFIRKGESSLLLVFFLPSFLLLYHRRTCSTP